MKFSDLYKEAVLWTCYLENRPNPERYLDIFGLHLNDLPLFDYLGKFFPFDEFYIRGVKDNIPRMIDNLDSSKKNLILPWMYKPVGAKDALCGKPILCPSLEMYDLLDNKVETKKLFDKFGIPTPERGFTNNGKKMLEKPIANSAGGLGIRLTDKNARAGYFLEEYIPQQRSIGFQFFVYDEVEFICANEMLFNSNGEDAFTFHAQKNVQKKDLPDALIEDCFKLLEYLLSAGYKGLIGIDVLTGDNGHYLLEINPRGIAFLPAFFAASARGWTNFITYMNKGDIKQKEIVLLDFGKSRKVVKEL